MRVLIVNTSERIGGAAIAANRLMEALNNNGIKAKMLVRDKQTDHVQVVPLEKSWKHALKFVWERICIWKANRFHKHRLFEVDLANVGADITLLPEFRDADVIHLHWINQGFLSLQNIERILTSGKPVVWTMHDMWPFTGICHYSGECTRYQRSCHHCPLLYTGGSKNDISSKVFMAKRLLYGKAKLTFVACSQWLESMAKSSKLLENQYICSIPNAINTNLFHPMNKQAARKKLNLPSDMRLLLFGSLKITDKRKGVDYLIEACRWIKEKYPDLNNHVAIVTMGKAGDEMRHLFPFPVYDLEYVSAERDLVDVYNAVDLYVTPSLQDNLPNTIVEAMACGVPCVGFHTGGIPQMIDHLHNGYVAEYKNAQDFANGIHWALVEDDYETLSEMATRKAQQTYSESTVAKRYIEIYNKAIGHEQ
ncbi:MAG: glycosyltransferase family 4 protein [Bacteroidaceae bacterium]|nr:glycosyltransferase family 4 protein [Bacteroidaceae bacterium]